MEEKVAKVEEKKDSRTKAEMAHDAVQEKRVGVCARVCMWVWVCVCVCMRVCTNVHRCDVICVECNILLVYICCSKKKESSRRLRRHTSRE